MAIFGFGAKDPYAEEAQLAQDRAAAFEGIKDNLPALGLIAGLSMLAHNNGSRSVGQLVGRAGADALNAYGTWQKLEEARQRQKLLDEERKEQREYDRSQDAFRNDMAERKFGLEAAKMAQDMQLARARLGMEGARLAMARAAAGAAAADRAAQEEYARTHRMGADGMPYVLRTGEDGKNYWEQDRDAMIIGKNGEILGVKQPEPKFTDTMAIAKDWHAASKDYFTLGDQINTLIANASQATGIGDAGMIYNIMKLFDPGSVVREGEFQTAQLSSGALDRINTYYKQALNGQRLTDAQRKDFVRLARDIYGKARQTQLARNERYSKLAKSGGIDASTFIYDPYADIDKTMQDYIGSAPKPGSGAGGAAPAPGAGANIPGVTGRGGPAGRAAPGAASLPPGFRVVR